MSSMPPVPISTSATVFQCSRSSPIHLRSHWGGTNTMSASLIRASNTRSAETATIPQPRNRVNQDFIRKNILAGTDTRSYWNNHVFLVDLTSDHTGADMRIVDNTVVHQAGRDAAQVCQVLPPGAASEALGDSI